MASSPSWAARARNQPARRAAVFELYLPRADATADAAGGTDAPLPRGHGERVLLVEDEKPLMLLAEEMLAALNFEPAGFTHAAEALAEFRVDPWRFDLVIVDHLLPGGNGIELARELRRARADVSIILLSGYTGPLLTQEASLRRHPAHPHQAARAGSARRGDRPPPRTDSRALIRCRVAALEPATMVSGGGVTNGNAEREGDIREKPAQTRLRG